MFILFIIYTTDVDDSHYFIMQKLHELVREWMLERSGPQKAGWRDDGESDWTDCYHRLMALTYRPK